MNKTRERFIKEYFNLIKLTEGDIGYTKTWSIFDKSAIILIW